MLKSSGKKSRSIREFSYSTGTFVKTFICSYFIIGLANLLMHSDESLSFSNLAFLQQSGSSGNFIFHCLSIVIIMALLTAAEFFFSEWKPAAHLMTVSWLLFALTALWKYDTSEPYYFCFALLFAAALVLLYATDKDCFSFVKSEFHPAVMWAAVIVIAVGFGFFITKISILRYLCYSAPNFDFGLFCNMFYNMKNTGLPNSTCERDMLLSHFAVHFSPVYYLMLPFFYIFPSPITLNVGQVIILYSGIIPLILLARKLRFSRKMILLISVVFAAYPALSAGCLYDLHENCFLLPFLLWVFYFFEIERYIPMAVFALLTLTVKEDAFIYIAFFALYLIFSRKKWKTGVVLLGGSVLYFAVVSLMMQKYGLGIMDHRFSSLIYDREDGLIGALKTLILNPGYILTQIFSTAKGNTDKLLYLLQLFLPLAFLPFATKNISRLILCVPVLVNILTMYVYLPNINFQYNFGITAFLFYASLLNLSEIGSFARKYLVQVAAAASILMFTAVIIPKYDYYSDHYEAHKDIYKTLDYVLAEILPETADVTASTFLVAHIADRDIIYEVTYHKDNEQYKTDTEFVVLDMRSGYSQTSLEQAEYFYSKGYSLYYSAENTILILRNENSGVCLFSKTSAD